MHGLDTAWAADGPTIARVDILPCTQRQDDPEWKFARGSITHIDGWLIRLEASSGEQGWGHVLGTPIYAPQSDRIAALLQRAVEGLAGASIWRLAEWETRWQALCPDDPCIRSGLQAAWLELQCQRLQQPLHHRFGGARHQQVPVTRLLPLKSPEQMAALARARQAEGYRHLKIKLDGNVALDLQRVEAVRAAVGAEMGLTADANQAYALPDALRLIEGLQPYGLEALEQPVAAADVAGLKRLRQAGRVPIEADEAIGSLTGLMHLLDQGAADYYNLKLHYLGGITQTWMAMRLCEAAGVRYRMGAIFGPRLLVAQGLHLAAVAEHLLGGAELAEFTHLLDDPFTGLDVENGMLAVPSTVGSGVAWTARSA